MRCHVTGYSMFKAVQNNIASLLKIQLNSHISTPNSQHQVRTLCQQRTGTGLLDITCSNVRQSELIPEFSVSMHEKSDIIKRWSHFFFFLMSL